MDELVQNLLQLLGMEGRVVHMDRLGGLAGEWTRESGKVQYLHHRCQGHSISAPRKMGRAGILGQTYVKSNRS